MTEVEKMLRTCDHAFKLLCHAYIEHSIKEPEPLTVRPNKKNDIQRRS
jgi:hypothetical protein